MKTNLFGNQEPSVSRLGFGAMGLGGAFGTLNETDGIRALLRCLENGVNFIDTARAYGDSERIVGLALRQWKGPRPFVATKVQSLYPGGVGWGTPVPVEEAFPKGWVTKCAEISLKELGLDTLDLLQLHQYWPSWDKRDYWLDELDELKRVGKIRFGGVSIPDQRHDIALGLVNSGRIDSVQTVFNIFDPLPLDCLIPACEEKGVAFLARCILDEGGLAGFLNHEIQFAEGDYRKSYFESVPRQIYMARVDRLKKFIPEHAQSLAELAIRFVLQHPAVTTALVSMHVPAYAEINIRAAAQPALPEAVFNELRWHHRWTRNFYETKFFS